MTVTQSQLVNLIRADGRRRKRRAALVDLITALITDAVLTFINGWYLMLAIGIAHDKWLPALPTIGYLWAVLIAYLLHGVFSKVPSKSKGGDQ